MANRSNTGTPASLTAAQIGASLSLIARWTAALHDKGDLASATADLAALLGAGSVTLTRHDAATARPIIHADAAVSALFALLRDRHPGSAVAGSLWRLADLMDDPSFGQTDACRHWANRPGVADVVLVVLQGTSDVLELVFNTAPSATTLCLLNLFAPALAEAWALRQPGLMARHILILARRNRPVLAHQNNVAILDFANPYGLSRAEFRVCRLLAEGLKARAIADALRLSEATVRTHLKSIYAKTETSGQFEVLYKIKASAPQRAA